MISSIDISIMEIRGVLILFLVLCSVNSQKKILEKIFARKEPGGEVSVKSRLGKVMVSLETGEKNVLKTQDTGQCRVILYIYYT